MTDGSGNITGRGLGITHYTWADAKTALLGQFGKPDPLHIVTLTPEMCVRAHNDPQFREIIDKAGMVVADGVGVAWGEGKLTGRKPEKIPGIELATFALDTLKNQNGRVYLLGSKPDVVKKAAETIASDYSPLTVAG